MKNETFHVFIEAENFRDFINVAWRIECERKGGFYLQKRAGKALVDSGNAKIRKKENKHFKQSVLSWLMGFLYEHRFDANSARADIRWKADSVHMMVAVRKSRELKRFFRR